MNLLAPSKGYDIPRPAMGMSGLLIFIGAVALSGAVVFWFAWTLISWGIS